MPCEATLLRLRSLGVINFAPSRRVIAHNCFQKLNRSKVYDLWHSWRLKCKALVSYDHNKKASHSFKSSHTTLMIVKLQFNTEWQLIEIGVNCNYGLKLEDLSTLYSSRKLFNNWSPAFLAMPFQNWWTPIDGPISQVIPLIEVTWIWCRPWCKTSRKCWESRRLPRAGMSVCASQCLVGLPPPYPWHSTQASRSGSHITMHRYETHNSLDIRRERQ